MRVIAVLCCFALLADAAPAVSSDRAAIAQWTRSMSLRDRIAQLIMAPCFGEDPASDSDEFKRFQHWVKDLHIGGFIMVNRIVSGTVRNAEPHAMASFFNRMQRISRESLCSSRVTSSVVPRCAWPTPQSSRI